MKRTENKEILFIGDSLIEFFDWQGRFPDRRVSNLGSAADTVRGLLARSEGIIKSHPDAGMVFIMSGINDLAMEDAGFLGPYGELLDRLTASLPGAEIFVNSLLPSLLPWVGPASIADANRRLKRLADEKGARFLDIHGLFEKAGVEGCLLPDGVHLNEGGYAVWSGAVEDAIGRR